MEDEFLRTQPKRKGCVGTFGNGKIVNVEHFILLWNGGEENYDLIRNLQREDLLLIWCPIKSYCKHPMKLFLL